MNVERSSACKKNKNKFETEYSVRFSFVLLEINELLSKDFCYYVAHSTLNKWLNGAWFYYLHFKSLLACAQQQRRWSKCFCLSGNYVLWNTLECVCVCCRVKPRFLLNDEDDEGKIVNILKQKEVL